MNKLLELPALEPTGGTWSRDAAGGSTRGVATEAGRKIRRRLAPPRNIWWGWSSRANVLLAPSVFASFCRHILGAVGPISRASGCASINNYILHITDRALLYGFAAIPKEQP